MPVYAVAIASPLGVARHGGCRPGGTATDLTATMQVPQHPPHSPRPIARKTDIRRIHRYWRASFRYTPTVNIGEFLGIATFIVIVLIGWCGMYALYHAAGKRGNRKREERVRLRQQAAQLDGHHTIHWRFAPARLRGTVEGWPVAANAMHTLCRAAPVDVFPFPDQRDEVEMLASWWGIASADHLRDQLLSLLRNGHRESFDRERSYWSALQGKEERHVRAALAQAARGNADAAEDFLRFRRVRENTRDLMNIDFLAWDLVRVIMLCRAGAAAGLIGREEAVDTALIASHGLRERFTAWEHLGNEFFRGRWYWASESGVDEALSLQHDEHAQRVLAADPNSPWKAVPWQIPLPAPSYLLLDNMNLWRLPAGAPSEGEWRKRLESEIDSRAGASY